jgi:RNA polymerase sigma-70 factor, ECF subfamily
MEPPSSADVAAWIRHARDGDPECRQQLFEAARLYLGLIARAQVEGWFRVKVDASDLVQQTMLEAHRDFSGFQGATEKEWFGWLRRILSHNVGDFVRRYRGTAKRRVGREVPFRDMEQTAAFGAPEPIADQTSPSQKFLQEESELRLAAALTQLPPDYHEVVMLRNLQHLPFEDVAKRMGRSRPAVQMLWMRAIRRLQELMTGGEKSDSAT